LTKYIVARFTNSGFGDHVSCVFGAWRYARDTGRTLIIDWRGSRFNQNIGENCFFDFFQKTNSIGGVPIVADDCLDWIPEATQIYPLKWSRKNLKEIKHVPHDAREIEYMNALMMSGEDRSENFVVVNQHFSKILPKKELKIILQDLKYHDSIEKIADKFILDFAKNQIIIGVHLRHGNGENIGSRASYWLDPISLMRQLIRDSQNDIHKKNSNNKPGGRFADNAADSLTVNPKRNSTEARLYKYTESQIKLVAKKIKTSEFSVILFTDASRVIAGMRESIPTVLFYPKKLFDAGQGPLHQLHECEGKEIFTAVDPRTIDGMLVEQALLRRCEALVCISSNFTEIIRAELADDRVVLLVPRFANRLIVKFISSIKKFLQPKAD
jgi:hypothetical protein